jgi:formylglycine-generating enzyme required for sulfatase activity
MNDQDGKSGGRSQQREKKAKRTRVIAGILSALALMLSVVLVMIGIETLEKKPAKKVFKEVLEKAEVVRRTMPPPLPPAGPEIVPWPTEGPLPYLGPIIPPVAAPPPVPPPPPLVKPRAVPKVSELAKARLFVDTEPEDATIRVLNIKRPYKRGMVIKKKAYHLEVSHRGYHTKRRWIKAEADRDNSFGFKLDRIVTTGTLLVQSSPPGAQWFLDGNLAGVTPGKKADVEQGDHLVVLKMDGFEQWSKTVWVKAKKRTSVEASLTNLDPKAGETWRDPVMGMVFVWIPKGCFNMGSPAGEAGRDLDEGPLHKVCLDGFWMGQTEVTNGQYGQYNPGHTSKAFSGQTLAEHNQPVVHVNWRDAKAFARWLTEQNGGPFSFRLPTEAEWEYACRAGSLSARFWGENPREACQFANVYDLASKQVNNFVWMHHDCDDGYAVTSPVGSFWANAFGLYDMLGNVWEWCEDTYVEDAYKTHGKKNPIHTDRAPFRVNRGGSWSDISRSTRCAVRERLDPGFGNYYLGFRLVRTPEE